MSTRLVLCTVLALATGMLMPPPASKSADPPPPACCVYGGNGSATAVGATLININDGTGTQYQEGRLSVSAEALALSFVFNGTSTQTSKAGWIISQNDTAQNMVFWYGSDQRGHGKCEKVSVPLPLVFIPGFRLCPGLPGGFFPDYAGSFTLGNVAVNNYINFPRAPGQIPQSGFFLNATHQCALQTLISSSPLNNDAFSFTVYGEIGIVVDPSLFTPPSYCYL
eukprot:m.152378 g.152378  ORF g.152378 m.152378 type:complete len:224 (+) comp9775_c0_seq2:42-713(+)